MNAQDILDSLVKTYRMARTYSDSGTVQVFTHPHNFKTYFSAPRKYRCEYPDVDCWVDKPGGTYRPSPIKGTSVLWSDGTNNYVKWFYKNEPWEETDKESVRRLHSTLHGFDSLLLLLGVKDSTVLNIESLNRIADDMIDGIECLRVQGSVHSPADTELWIAKDTYVLRRVRQKNWFPVLRERGIADDIPSNESLPFNRDCIYNEVHLNRELDDTLFSSHI